MLVELSKHFTILIVPPVFYLRLSVLGSEESYGEAKNSLSEKVEPGFCDILGSIVIGCDHVACHLHRAAS